MATLKEAVESGRRWRHPKWPKDYWRKPGHLGHPETIRLDEALSSDFEIEPGPACTASTKAPGGVYVCTRLAGHEGSHVSQAFGNSVATWAEPGPKKPREWEVVVLSHGTIVTAGPRGDQVEQRLRVHDADACDRLYKELLDKAKSHDAIVDFYEKMTGKSVKAI